MDTPSLTEEEMAPFQGEANASLAALPLEQFLAEVAAWQADYNTPDDEDWPTEDGKHPFNP